MATYNTAYGTLPGYNEQLGKTNTTAGGQDTTYDPSQQKPKKRQQSVRFPTFADLQKEGQARPPAPTMAQSTSEPPMQNLLRSSLSAEPAAANPALTTQLSSVLYPAASAAPAAAAVAAPAVAAAPAAAAQPAASVASPAVTAQGGATVTPSGIASPTFALSAEAIAMRKQLADRLTAMQAAPSAYDDPALKAIREATMANMQAEYGAKASSLEEDMARRGISASSIASGRYGDLAGQQARAQATFEADLMQQSSQAEAARQKSITDALGSLFASTSESELGGFNANTKSTEVTNAIDQRAQEIQQTERLRGRELTIQEATQRANEEYNTGRLSLETQASGDTAYQNAIAQWNADVKRIDEKFPNRDNSMFYPDKPERWWFAQAAKLPYRA